MDECACCDSATDNARYPWRRRHPTTGACYDPDPPAPPPQAAASAGAAGSGSTTAASTRAVEYRPPIVLVSDKTSGATRAAAGFAAAVALALVPDAAPLLAVCCWLLLAGADEPAASKVLPPDGECRCSADDPEEGQDHGGSDIKALTPAEGNGGKEFTPQECCVICAATPECEYYMVSTEAADVAKTICWLKSHK